MQNFKNKVIDISFLELVNESTYRFWLIPNNQVNVFKYSPVFELFLKCF